jgi:colanic acid/amylovoran biosynthesis protein
MMAINLIEGLAARNANLTFWVDANTEEDVERLKRSLTVPFVERTQVEARLFRGVSTKVGKGLSFVAKLPLYAQKVGRDFDAVLFVGGDDLSEGYSKAYALLTLSKIFLIARRRPVFIVGQTIGPFSGLRRRLGHCLLERVTIFSRDPHTHEYLTKQLGLLTVRRSSDLAFADLPLQATVRMADLRQRLELPDGSYFTLVPSGYVSMYTSDRAAYIRSWIGIVRRMLDLGGPETSLVLLPHVLKRSVDDRVVIRQIVQSLSREENQRVTPVYREVLPREARAVLGAGALTVTGRMHAAVSTFQMGKPAISVSYSPKYAGVIGAGLGLPEFIVDGRTGSPDVWRSGRLINEVVSKVQLLVHDYDALCQRVVSAVQKAKADVDTMVAQIAASLS